MDVWEICVKVATVPCESCDGIPNICLYVVLVLMLILSSGFGVIYVRNQI